MGIPAAILSSDGRGWAVVSPPVSLLSLSLPLTITPTRLFPFTFLTPLLDPDLMLEIFPLHRLVVLT